MYKNNNNKLRFTERPTKRYDAYNFLSRYFYKIITKNRKQNLTGQNSCWKASSSSLTSSPAKYNTNIPIHRR